MIIDFSGKEVKNLKTVKKKDFSKDAVLVVLDGGSKTVYTYFGDDAEVKSKFTATKASKKISNELSYEIEDLTDLSAAKLNKQIKSFDSLEVLSKKAKNLAESYLGKSEAPAKVASGDTVDAILEKVTGSEHAKAFVLDYLITLQQVFQITKKNDEYVYSAVKVPVSGLFEAPNYEHTVVFADNFVEAIALWRKT